MYCLFNWYREASKQNFDSLIALITRKAPKAHSLLQFLFWSSSEDLPCLKATAATANFTVASAGADLGPSLVLMLYNLGT